MAKTIQYVNKNWVKFQNYACLREKGPHNKSWDIIYLGATIFEEVVFFTSDDSRAIFLDLCFTIFIQVLMKELVGILVRVCKIFNCRVSIKMMLSMCLVIIEKELWRWLWSSNFQNSTFEKITITVVEVALIQVSFPKVGSKQKK